MGLASGQRLLDVGCGGGHVLQAAAELGGPAGLVVHIDADATMTAASQARVADRLSVSVCLADAQRLPFADGASDGCRAERVLQHLDGPAAALAEMARVTRAGGLVLVGDTDWGGCLLDPPTTRPPTRCCRPPPAAPNIPGSGGSWSASSSSPGTLLSALPLVTAIGHKPA